MSRDCTVSLVKNFIRTGERRAAFGHTLISNRRPWGWVTGPSKKKFVNRLDMSSGYALTSDSQAQRTYETRMRDMATWEDGACHECERECETVQASYHVELLDGSEINVCDSHLDILTENAQIAHQAVIRSDDG